MQEKLLDLIKQILIDCKTKKIIPCEASRKLTAQAEYCTIKERMPTTDTERGEMWESYCAEIAKKCALLKKLPSTILDGIKDMERCCLGFISKETKQALKKFLKEYSK